MVFIFAIKEYRLNFSGVQTSKISFEHVLPCVSIVSDTFSMVAIPVYLRHNISYKEGSSGRLDITVGPKQTMGKLVYCVVSGFL